MAVLEEGSLAVVVLVEDSLAVVALVVDIPVVALHGEASRLVVEVVVAAAVEPAEQPQAQLPRAD